MLANFFSVQYLNDCFAPPPPSPPKRKRNNIKLEKNSKQFVPVSVSFVLHTHNPNWQLTNVFSMLHNLKLRKKEDSLNFIIVKYK